MANSNSFFIGWLLVLYQAYLVLAEENEDVTVSTFSSANSTGSAEDEDSFVSLKQSWEDSTLGEKITIVTILFLVLIICPLCMIYALCIRKDKDGHIVCGHWEKHPYLETFFVVLLAPLTILLLFFLFIVLMIAVTTKPDSKALEEDRKRRDPMAWQEQEPSKTATTEV